MPVAISLLGSTGTDDSIDQLISEIVSLDMEGYDIDTCKCGQKNRGQSRKKVTFAIY